MDKQSPKYSFYYLLSLVALIFTAISVGLILFGIIDDSFRDAWAYNSYNSADGQYKFAISALLIAAPCYYLSIYLIKRGLKIKELSLDSSVRRWLTYLIIFVNALIILGVFIGIVNNFLSGALTAPFMMKLASVLVIAGFILSYYFWDIRRDEFAEKSIFQRLYCIISVVLISAVFISAWFFVESPADARANRLDENLISNINQLEGAVNRYYEKHERLPENLAELKSDSIIYLGNRFLLDADSGNMIEYKVEGEKDFVFCADFRRSSSENSSHYIVDKSYEAGYDCVKGKLWLSSETTKF